jgi:hypothetical protein
MSAQTKDNAMPVVPVKNAKVKISPVYCMSLFSRRASSNSRREIGFERIFFSRSRRKIVGVA